MNLLKERFDALERDGKRPVIPYLMAGYPSLDVTGRLLAGLDAASIPIVEVGIPFSDPVADGPTIQAASTAALQQGTTPEKVLDLLADVCPTLKTRVVIMTYLNPILAYGAGAFWDKMVSGGVAGLLPVDLPPEETERFFPGYRSTPVGMACLAAPNSPATRVKTAAAAATGMIYLTSRLGVTGSRQDVPPGLIDRLKSLRAQTGLPVVAGFGFSRREQVETVLPHCSGVVVGSFLVNAMTGKDKDSAVTAYLESLGTLLPEEK